jgi:hypothetical protein
MEKEVFEKLIVVMEGTEGEKLGEARDWQN